MEKTIYRSNTSQKSEAFGRFTGMVSMSLAAAVTFLGMSLIAST
jgi:hypothetical protein